MEALALFPEKDISLGFQEFKEFTAEMTNEKLADLVSYFEATRLGEKFSWGVELRPPSCLQFGANLKTPKKCAKKPITLLKGGTVP